MMDKLSKKKKDAYNSTRSSAGSNSRATDATSRASSTRSTSTSQSASQSQSDSLSGALLPSADVTRGYDIRAHLRQILTFSEDDDDESSDDYSLESFDGDDDDAELRKLVDSARGQGGPATPKPTNPNGSQALMPVTEDDEDDLPSEEENEIMKEIKAEITKNLRQEMKSELDLYQAKKEKLQAISDGKAAEGAEGSGTTGKGPLYEGLDDLDPKLKQAIIKMRKLDKVLTKRVRREKEVKRDRILLERRIRREIEDLHEEGKGEYKEVLTNEQKFLALELPARHNEEKLAGVSDESQAENNSDTDNSSNATSDHVDKPADVIPDQTLTPPTDKNLTPPTIHQETGAQPESEHKPKVSECWGAKPRPKGVVVPDKFTGDDVFATQLNEEEYPGLHGNKEGGDAAGHRKAHAPRAGSKQSSEDGESRGDASSVASGSVDGRKHKKRRKKDFIKRNKELAADASNMIAMTEEEKQRLHALLHDVDNIPEIPEGIEIDDTDINPFQIAVRPGEGFHPDQDELRALTSIDSRLKEIMPPDDYRSIASSSMSHIPQQKLFTHTGVKHEVDWENRGERVLFQNAEQRDMNDRMSAIDDELAKIHNPEDELETPHLGEDQLNDLIEQCITSLSHTSMSRLTLTSESRTSHADTESIISHDIDSSMENSARSPRSARQEILDNPPVLAPDMLQKLLSEAYHPLSKQLSTLREVENEDDEEECTPIPADVWKLIAMEKVGESMDNSTDITENNEESSNNMTGLSRNKHSAGSRNGLKSMSRNSSLSQASENGRQSREIEPLKLPEIDPTGTLITKGSSSGRNSNTGGLLQRSSSIGSSRTPSFSRNNSSDSRMEMKANMDSRMEVMSLDGDFTTPRPPSGEKREGSMSKSRTLTPASSRASVS